MRLTGPSLSKKKITVHILDDINGSIQKYMLMLLTTNLLVGLLSWIAFHWIGLENAGAWAAAAGVLHVVPYLGPGVTAVATGMAAFMQFESFAMALLVAGASLAIATVVGTFVTTWMTGRIARHEFGGGVHFAAVLGLAVGRLGNAAQHSHHRHRRRSCRSTSSSFTRSRNCWEIELSGSEFVADGAVANGHDDAAESPASLSRTSRDYRGTAAITN